MEDPFEAVADVQVKDGLVCITVKADGAPETVLRFPRGLALQLADRIGMAARRAPLSYPTKSLTQD